MVTDRTDKSSEPVMANVVRRQLLSALPSMLLMQSPWQLAIASSTRADANDGLFQECDYPHGCIFARMGSLHSASCKSEPASAIDFWTFRVSEIEANDLPPNIGKVVFWDDVFSSRGLCERVREILEAVRRYYYFDVALSSNTFGFHLQNCSGIGPVIASVLSNSSFANSSVRIALIDIASIGVSRFGWPDILPHLRAHYDLVVGFAHFAGKGPMHLRAMFGDEIDHSYTWSAIAHCDLSFLTSDALLGFDQVLDCDMRQPHLGAMLRRLIRSLSTAEFLHTVIAENGARIFCIGALPLQSSANSCGFEAIERHRHILSSDIFDEGPELPIVFAERDKRGVPVISKGLSLWPLRAASAV